MKISCYIYGIYCTVHVYVETDRPLFLRLLGEVHTSFHLVVCTIVLHAVCCLLPLARELLDVSCDSPQLQFKMKGCVTNANYSVKKLTFLLFINRMPSMGKVVSIVNFLLGLFLFYIFRSTGGKYIAEEGA